MPTLLATRYPDGHVVRVLGPVNDLKAEAEAVLEHAGITWQVGRAGRPTLLPSQQGCLVTYTQG